jgi:hypothetical protein
VQIGVAYSGVAFSVREYILHIIMIGFGRRIYVIDLIVIKFEPTRDGEC